MYMLTSQRALSMRGTFITLLAMRSGNTTDVYV